MIFRSDLSGANLSRVDLSGANLSEANLSEANLSRVDLSGANLSEANLWGATGNMDQLKSIFLEEYPITYTSEYLQIGCQKHLIHEWLYFDDREILAMGGKTALNFWIKYKDYLMTTIELSPATPTKGNQ